MRYLALAVLTSVSTADYVWPGEHDHMEDLLYLQFGFNRFGFVDGILSCGFGQSVQGSQNSAEWIRTAYHDMATADVEAGTGGLDMSIMFELNRDENRGNAFGNTFGHLANFYATRSSGADLLARVCWRSRSVCGGYDVLLRVGRIDATEAGRSGVPEPQQDLDTHTKMFAMQGFNQTEMIELVACGHTLGGVHHEDFPEITGVDTKGQVTHFEYGNSNTAFDNQVVTEYLQGNTSNPLVSGSNDTTNSDKRIFAAGGNKTMQALSDPTYFQERCQSLMTRMIDTVPSTVTLSEPLTPIDIKPYINMLALNTKGTLDFSGYIRVRYGADTGRSADDLAAYITYTDRSGKNVSTPINGVRSTYQGGTAVGFHDTNFVFFAWDTQLDAAAGISKFHIHVTTKSTNETVVYENGGAGFPVQDTVLYQRHQSCLSFAQNGNGGWDGSITVVAAVRSDALNASASAVLALHFASHVSQGAGLDRLEVQVEKFVRTEQTVAGYELFEAKGMAINQRSDSTTFDIVLDEATKVDFQLTSPLKQESCKPLVQ
ncbi:heme peroxidase [Bimuria novae-zelandiae CBS 107.79]|uniref:Peroxidase n=1 Tax=Bimuria novae-zelandiae CBS 107.79 TaxID=1447943 RepID=A0A6A5UMQ3_9PLEO|nr:heme peroxidase [Bimuria novae-zelandiae CBS 107.79]